MADSSLTVGELFKAKAVTDEQVNAAVNANLAKSKVDAHPMAGRYSLDQDGWLNAFTVVVNREVARPLIASDEYLGLGI